MYICNCRPSGYGLNTDDVVKAVREGCSTMKELVAKTGAGTNCHTCVPTLLKIKPVVAELAKERAASGTGWPTGDQYESAKKAVNDAAR